MTKPTTTTMTRIYIINDTKGSPIALASEGRCSSEVPHPLPKIAK